MDLYHFYDKRTGPFRSLTKLKPEEAKEVLERIKAERPDSFVRSVMKNTLRRDVTVSRSFEENLPQKAE